MSACCIDGMIFACASHCACHMRRHYTTGSMPMDAHNRLIQSLTNGSVYPHPTTEIVVLQTHISWVVLTGPYTYKIKKPVNLGFVDFSTLAKRHFFCQEELRLNC